MTTRGHMPDDSTYYGIVDAYRKGPVGDSVLGIYKVRAPPLGLQQFPLKVVKFSEKIPMAVHDVDLWHCARCGRI